MGVGMGGRMELHSKGLFSSGCFSVLVWQSRGASGIDGTLPFGATLRVYDSSIG